MSDLTMGREIGKRLVDAGLVPSHVRRIVIDIQIDEPVKVYYECFAGKSLVNEMMDSLLTGKPLVQEVKAASETCQSCNVADAKPLSECPFALEIHNQCKMCNCCDGCRTECARDI